MLNKYINEYIADFDFGPCEHISGEMCGINFEIDVMEYRDDSQYREKAHIVLKKGFLTYECDCIDSHNWDEFFFPLTLSGRAFLCFRKTLYGFTLLDTDTLTEKYDFFPSEVLEGKESFIIADAKSFEDLIIFDGCYWACPYAYFAYDHAKKRFLNLSREYGLHSENKYTAEKDALILIGSNDEDEEVRAVIAKEEIYRLLNEKGTDKF